jgi:hypothetical protein
LGRAGVDVSVSVGAAAVPWILMTAVRVGSSRVAEMSRRIVSAVEPR